MAYIELGGTIHNTEVDHVAVEASEVKDIAKNMYQSQVNAATDSTLAAHASAINGLEGQNYVTLVATDADTDIAAVFTRLGVTPAINTIYRIANWKHDAITKYNTAYYSEYAANGTTTADLVPISVENKGIDNTPQYNSPNMVESGGLYNEFAERGIYDISAKHPTSGVEGGNTYASLTAALAVVPSTIQKGGMSIKFIQSSDNKYVQYRYMGTSTAVADFTNTANWQGVDEEPTYGSENLIKSSGVFSSLYAFEENGSVTFEQTKRNESVRVQLEVGQLYKLVMSVTGLSDTDIDNLQYFRVCTSSEVGTQINSHTFDTADKTALKSSGEWVYEYSAEQDTDYIQLLFTQNYVPTSGNSITITNKVSKAIYETAPLKGKTIVLFGDSITEFSDTNRIRKRYSDYIEEYTGAKCINVGIGGTCLRERHDPVIVEPGVYHLSDYAALDIINMVKAACGIDYNETYSYLDLAQIAAEQIRDYKESRDDNTAQIARLAAIDWSKVDYVTILGGTNDWHDGNKNQWGESGSMDCSTTLGAINEIIRLLLSTYKHLRLIWLTPIVRWIDYDGSSESMISEKFSDYYKYDETTLKELSAQIQQEATLNHIPVCDLYNGLGWNMSNFSEYFTVDGTHPLAGFQYLGRKISEFIQSGNSETKEIVPVSDIYQKIENETQRAKIAEKEYIEDIESPSYIEATIDGENKILEGTKADGTKEFYTDVKLHGKVSTEVSELSVIELVNNYIEAKTDGEGKLIEGVTTDGRKHISQFDASTEDVIRNIAGNSGNTGGNIIRISQLDANFISPVPVVITGTKGDENAKYEFELPLNESAYNIRFKFHITENLVNQEKSAVIGAINGAEIHANVIPITACQTTTVYEGQQKTVNWPATDGGIAFNSNSIDRKLGKRNIGQQAFSIQYLGDDMNATVENTGNELILTINNSQTTYSFLSYPTVGELYNALSSNPNIKLQFNAMDKRNCSELIVFPPVHLRSTFYCNDDGSYEPEIEEHIDSAPFYIHYAVQPDWHQVEIVRIGNKLYSTCDGVVSVVPTPTTANILTLGGECGVIFKDVEICLDSPSDAEVINDTYIISEVNPYIAILMVHGMADCPAYDFENMLDISTYVSSENPVHFPTLSDAILSIGANDRKGKMKIRFILRAGESDAPTDKYVLYEFLLDTFTQEQFNNISNWKALSTIETMNVDTMDYILSHVSQKGYLPISVTELAEYYTGHCSLPKRCYTLVFDDVRWQECLNLNFRKVFSRYGSKPALAMITNRYDYTTHNGQTISNKEATQICNAVGWDVITHTSTHRSTYALKPSQYLEYLTSDIYNADNILADGSIFVYPGGASDVYILDVLEFLGFKCAMTTAGGDMANNTIRNRFNLTRINVSRIISNDGTPINYNTLFMNRLF